MSAVHTAQKRGLAPHAAANFAPGGGQRVKRQTVAPPQFTAGVSEGAPKLELKECKKLMKDLVAHKAAWPFSRPVDITKYPDYYRAITQPMDLGTAKVCPRSHV